MLGCGGGAPCTAPPPPALGEATGPTGAVVAPFTVTADVIDAGASDAGRRSGPPPPGLRGVRVDVTLAAGADPAGCRGQLQVDRLDGTAPERLLDTAVDGRGTGYGITPEPGRWTARIASAVPPSPGPSCSWTIRVTAVRAPALDCPSNGT